VLIPIEQLLTTLAGECYSRRNVLVLFFVIISLTCLAVGTVWPKKYTTFSIIHIDESNILQPLMRGAAEATQTIDHVVNAREIIFGEVIMDQILLDAGWLDDNPSEVEQEKIKNELKSRIIISGIGENLLKIEYLDSKAQRAYITSKRLTELFIEEGEQSKIEESESAYNFINKQVNEYLEKLSTVEEELRVFKSDNPDSRSGLENEVSSHISRLSRDIEDAELLLREALIKKVSLTEQLSGEAAITISQTRESQYRTELAASQSEIEMLHLDYKETHPDIVKLKHRIEDLINSLNTEVRNREETQKLARETGKIHLDSSITLNPLYEQLRGNLSEAETEIVTLQARIDELKSMLKKEYDRARDIYDGQATLSKLTRNYQVNQEIYQDLLRRLENARVSKNLDVEQQGLTFKIQEPAKIPLLPTGIRFLHFVIAGMALGVSVPIGFIYLMLQMDPRIRFSQIISTELNIPVLAEVNMIESLSESRSRKINVALLFVCVLIVFCIYGYVGWLKFTGQL